MNTTNYNSENFSDKNKNGELYISNQSALNEFNKVGKCNNCKHFNFGAKKCRVTGRIINTTMTTVTDKGVFISCIKPSDCKDFARKGKDNPKTEQDNTSNG